MVRVLFFLFFLFVLSCKEENDAPIPTTGQLTITLSHTFDGAPFKLDSFYAEPTNGLVSAKVVMFYLTNIKLIHQDGSEYALPETYFLVDESNPKSKTITIKNILPGNYKGIKFLTGVDSARNVGGIQSGALDPSLGMFWTWKSGYIQSKLEGNFIDADGEAEFIHHLGGFSGENNTVYPVELVFSETQLNAGQTLDLTIKRDLAEWFKTPFAVPLRTYKVIIDEGQQAKTIAINALDMYEITSAKIIQ